MRFEVALDRGARRPARPARSGRAGEPVAVPGSDTGATVDPMPADASLDVALDQARRGEDAGFLTLYRGLQPRLLRYLKVRTTDSADDVAAETWLHVVRDIGQFRGGADDFRAWVFTVARNRSIDAARARTARPLVT